MTVSVPALAHGLLRDRPAPGCQEGAHHGVTTTDRSGRWFWMCARGCGAERPQGGTWTPPREVAP